MIKKTKKISILFIIVLFMFSLTNAGNDDFFIDKKTISQVEKKYGTFAKNRVHSLIKLMNSLKNAPEDKKLLEVNNFFNKVRYQSDLKTWGEKDYWATRMEFLGKDKGDCEDYATAKYFTLKELGVSESKMYLSYVTATKQKVAHMVLTYFKTKRSMPLVLDNYNKKILPANKRPDLIPIYSFNAQALYLAKQQGLGKQVPSGLTKNKKWVKLLQDIKRNKI